MSLQVVHTYSTPWEAGMAKSILEAEGVPAIADDTTLTGVTGAFYSNDPPGYHVRVDSAFLDRARELLRDWEENSEPLPEEGEEAADDENEEPSGEPPEGLDGDESEPESRP